MDAIAEGLARTAGLITSAAAIMIVVFAAFTFGDFLVVKMIGFTLAVAVLIDATLVRILIGPSLLRIAGDWYWWPGGLATARRAAGMARCQCYFYDAMTQNIDEPLSELRCSTIN